MHPTIGRPLPWLLLGALALAAPGCCFGADGDRADESAGRLAVVVAPDGERCAVAAQLDDTTERDGGAERAAPLRAALRTECDPETGGVPATGSSACGPPSRP